MSDTLMLGDDGSAFIQREVSAPLVIDGVQVRTEYSIVYCRDGRVITYRPALHALPAPDVMASGSGTEGEG